MERRRVQEKVLSQAEAERFIIRVLFEWEDAKDERPAQSVLYPILNDSDKKTIKAEYIDALKSHNIDCFFWSQRKDFLSRLSM